MVISLFQFMVHDICPASTLHVGFPGRTTGKLLQVLLLLVLVVAPAPGARAENMLPMPTSLATAMAEYLECYPLELLSFKGQQPATVSRNLCLAEIYHKKGLTPLWVSAHGPGSRAVIILTALKNCAAEGLNPEDYGVAEIMPLWNARDTRSLAKLDTLITFNLIRYVHDVSRGQIKLRYIDPLLFAEAGDVDFNPLSTVDAVLETPDLPAFFAALPPPHTHYADLKKALQIYRHLARQGGWPTIAQGKTLRPGDRDARIPALMQRLAVTGDLLSPVADEGRYGEVLVSSVKGFQARHGLVPDGVVGPKTLAALNIPVHAAILKIIINMARWRWQAHDLGQKYILINIAGFTLSGFDHGEIKLHMPVIVGERQHQTPVFSDRVRYIDFNPYWNITPNIARNEELPGLRRDPMHLVNRHIRLFSSWQSDAVELDSTSIDWHKVSRRQMVRFKLRQDPGPWNALGTVKFIFPNEYDVYMHDTPGHHLFREHERNFSHGCIRVSDPQGLATFILAEDGNGWNRERVAALIEEGERRVVRPDTPVPVHITYQTVWVNKEGRIYFNRDIYGRDKKLGRALFPGEVIR